MDQAKIAYIGFGRNNVKPWELVDIVGQYDAVITPLMLCKSLNGFDEQYDSLVDTLEEKFQNEPISIELLRTGMLTEGIINQLLETKLEQNKKLRTPPPYKSGWTSRNAYKYWLESMSDMNYANDSIPKRQAEEALKQLANVKPKRGFGILMAQIAQNAGIPFMMVKDNTPFTLEGEVSNYVASFPFNKQAYASALPYIQPDFRKATGAIYTKLRHS